MLLTSAKNCLALISIIRVKAIEMSFPVSFGIPCTFLMHLPPIVTHRRHYIFVCVWCLWFCLSELKVDSYYLDGPITFDYSCVRVSYLAVISGANLLNVTKPAGTARRVLCIAFLRLHRMHQAGYCDRWSRSVTLQSMLPLPIYCLSRGWTAQQRLNGSRSCSQWRLLGTKSTFPIRRGARCGLCPITLFVINMTWRDAKSYRCWKIDFCRTTRTVLARHLLWRRGCRSVYLSVCLCACHVDVSCRNNWVVRHATFTRLYPSHFSFPVPNMNPITQGDPPYWGRHERVG